MSEDTTTGEYEEFIDVDDYDEGDATFHTPATQQQPSDDTLPHDFYYTAYSDKRRTKARRCAVPDTHKTQDDITLDDLLSNNIIPPHSTLHVEGFPSANGVLLRDGWIEYGTDKYPSMEAWFMTLKRKFKTFPYSHRDVDYWEVVSTKGHNMAHYREQLVELLGQMKRAKREMKKHKKTNSDIINNSPKKKSKKSSSSPRTPKQRHTEQQQQQQQQQQLELEQLQKDEDVSIDDEPSEQMVLPHKKRKVDLDGNEANTNNKANSNNENKANLEHHNESASSLVDLLADLSSPLEQQSVKSTDAKPLSESTPWTTRIAKSSCPPSNTPPSSPNLGSKVSPRFETSFQPSPSGIPSVDHTFASLSTVSGQSHGVLDVSSTELGAFDAHLAEHAQEVENFNSTAHTSSFNQVQPSLATEKVILGTGMKSQMLTTLQTLVEQLGGRLTHDFSEGVTHVVTVADPQGSTPRTLKYCSAVLSGAWILSFDWVLASLAEKVWVDEAPYEIKGDSHGGAPEKSRAAIAQGKARLFVGRSFCFVGKFNHPSPPRGDLENVLRVGGATILPNVPLPPISVKEFLEISNKTLVICDPASFTQLEATEVQMACSLAPISYQWVLDSISAYELARVDAYKFVPNTYHFETQHSLDF